MAKKSRALIVILMVANVSIFGIDLYEQNNREQSKGKVIARLKAAARCIV